MQHPELTETGLKPLNDFRLKPELRRDGLLQAARSKVRLAGS